MRTMSRSRSTVSRIHRHAESGPDIVDLLRREHGAIRSALERALGTSADERWTAHDVLADLTVRHDIAEELVVYPAVLRLRGGAAVTDSHLQDQDEIERLLVVADRAPFDSGEFDRASARLGTGILAHLENVESQVLPMLRTMVGARRRADLGRRFLEVENLAPVHQIVPGARRATGPTVVDRSAALAVWMRDSAVFSGLAS
jgi:hypothetical protein